MAENMSSQKTEGKLKKLLSGKKGRRWIVLCVLAVAVIGGGTAFLSRTRAKAAKADEAKAAGADYVGEMDLVEKIQKEKQAWEQKQNGGSSNGNRQKSKEYQRVMVKVDEMEHVQQVQQKIKDMGFRATSLTDELEAMKETTRMLRLVLGAIGAISMVVAAISITNTMVMAIYERTKEIGIMKVIGASLKDIKGLFLTEAAFIGFSGGIIGIIVSYGASFLVNFVAQRQGSTMQSAIPIWLALGGVAFSTAVGVIAGYLPAKRAMKLSALMAIKTE